MTDSRLQTIRNIIKLNLTPGKRNGRARWIKKVKIHLQAIHGDKCCYCSKKMTFRGQVSNPNYATIEHIIPLHIGGDNSFGNLRIACHACNNWADCEIRKIIKEINDAKV